MPQSNEASDPLGTMIAKYSIAESAVFSSNLSYLSFQDSFFYEKQNQQHKTTHVSSMGKGKC